MERNASNQFQAPSNTFPTARRWPVENLSPRLLYSRGHGGSPDTGGTGVLKSWEADTISEWYYQQAGSTLGPVSQSDFDALVKGGRIQGETLVCRTNGAWQPFKSSVDGLDATPRTCSICQGAFLPEFLMTYQRADFCIRCKRDFFQHLSQGTRFEKVVPPHFVARRVMAKMVDANLTALFQFALVTTLEPLSDIAVGYSPALAGTCLTLMVFVGGSALFTAFKGGTPGKLLFQLQVVYKDGTPVGFGSALVRSVAELLTLACGGLGYFLRDGEGARRTLHDRISGTEVIAGSGGWPWAP